MAFVQEQMDRSLRIALRKGNIAQQKARPRVASEELFFFSFKRQQEKFNEAGAWKAVFFFFFAQLQQTYYRKGTHRLGLIAEVLSYRVNQDTMWIRLAP